MLQRVGICQALLHDPDLIILDEPMSGLDPLGRAMVRDLILAERGRGKTIFFSSHILSDVEAICDTVAILVGGELRGVGTVGSLIGNRVSAVEIGFSGAEFALEQGETLPSVGEQQRVRVEPGSAEKVAAMIRDAGGRVLEIHRVRADLETVLVEEMSRFKGAE
jgi:ABC-2 type transport system ATP-binding protein